MFLELQKEKSCGGLDPDGYEVRTNEIVEFIHKRHDTSSDV